MGRGPRGVRGGAREEGERGGYLRTVGEEWPRVAGRILGKQGLGEAQLVAEWATVVGPELATTTLPVKLSFPAGGRRSGTLKLRVTSTAALAVQHPGPQILERVNGLFRYCARAPLVLVQGPPAQ